MRTFLKLISSILLCSLVIGLVPVTVFAKEPTPQTTVSNNAISISGPGSFGQLLGQELSAQQNSTNSTQYPYGYTVSSLEFQENTAIVGYEAAQDAILLVAVYTEDGNMLLNCANAEVSADMTQARVVLPGEMPEYFYASAYLINPIDYAPLCDQYDTPMYTQQMRKLLKSTVKDYNSNLVWNLDDDQNTNFAVFKYNVHRIKYKEGFNILVSADSETLTYVFENCNSSFTSLWSGRTIAYMWQGQPLIIQIASIQVDGTTVTITGGELTMAEVFQYIKIEGNSNASDIIVQDDPNSPFAYVPPVQAYSARTTDEPMDGTETLVDKKLTFTPKNDDEESGKPVDFSISGSLEVTLNGYLDYYLAETYQFLDVCIDYSAAVSLSFKLGKEQDKSLDLPLPSMECPLVIGVVSITFKPTLKFEWSVEASITGTISGNLAFQYDSIHGASDHSSDPTFQTSVKLEGTVKFGIDWQPGITVGGAYDLYILHIDLSLFTGVELTVTATSPINEVDPAGNPKVIHGCTTCIAGEFKPVFTLELKISFLADLIEFSLDIWECDLPSFLTFYMSCDNGKWDFGLGSCPNQAQRVAVHVKEHDNSPAKNVTVTVTGTARKFGQDAQDTPGTSSWTQTYTTDENGIAYIYLYSGPYLFSALDMMVGQQIGEPCRVMIHSDTAVALDILLEGGMDPATILDPGVVAFGNAGAEGYDVSWILYGSGELHIQGEGPMYEDWDIPWSEYRDYIRTVYIHDGVTTVGNSAFAGCERLVAVEIADSVEHIGGSAFSYCENIRKVQLSKNLKTLGDRAFYDCRILQELTLPDSLTSWGEYCFYRCKNLETVNIPQGATDIPTGAFRECESLTRIAIPDSVTSIGESAFYWCTSLVSVVVPSGVTEIADWTFGYCTALQAAVLPEGLLSIGEHAFYRNDVLLSVNIPSTVLTIGREAFSHCGKLQSIVLPEGLTTIPVQCFYECNSLINTRIPENVTTIGAKAFAACSSFTEVIIPEGVTTIEQGAFAYCDAIGRLSLPDTLTKIGGGTSIGEVLPTGAFEHCYGLTEVVIPNNVEVDAGTFYYCKKLSTVVVGKGVTGFNDTYITGGTFEECVNLSRIYFCGSNPGITSETFKCNQPKVSLTAYYPAGDSTWTSADLPERRGLLFSKAITWAPWDPGNGTSEISAALDLAPTPDSFEEEPERSAAPDEPAAYASYEGEFDTQFTEEGTLKTASFTGLCPGVTYFVVNVVSLEGNLLASDNLLAIRQCIAEADGTLRLQYLQRVPTDNTYVLAFGIGNRDIAAASVTAEVAAPNGSVQHPQFRLTLNGRTLREGTDYILSGDVEYLLPGTYSATVTGIGSFYGTKVLTYTAADESPFPDVGKNHSFKDYILWGYRSGIVSGDKQGYFNPEKTVTRGQFIIMLWRAAGKPEPTQFTAFPDVSENSGFYTAVCWAVEKGITNGKKDGNFGVNDPCTRGHVALFLYRYAGSPGASGTVSFPDVTGGTYYNAVCWAAESGITSGQKDGTFGVSNPCKRMHATKFLYLFLNEA